MIIYGWNAKKIKQAPIENACVNCGEKNAKIAIFSYYVHVFWIPLFPYKKSAQLVCSNCKNALEDGDFPKGSEMRKNLRRLKDAVKSPKYMYVGSVILLLAVSYIAFLIIQSSKLERGYLENPQVGDVYVLKDFKETSPYNHYLLKVHDIVDDSLYMTFSSFSYDRIVSRLDPKDGFYDVWYSMHKDQLRQYDESGELKKIIRDYSAYSGFDRVIEYPFLDSAYQEPEYVTEPSVQGF